MVADTEHRKTRAQGKAGQPGTRYLGWLAVLLRRMLGHYLFSSLTRRILILNFAAIGVLVVGVLYINQNSDGLIEAHIDSLTTQGEIVAGAIAASATVEMDTLKLTPEKLLELQAGESMQPGVDHLENLDFPINPETVAPLLRRLISNPRTRARVYGPQGDHILDSKPLYASGQVLRYDLPPLDEERENPLWRIYKRISTFFSRDSLPLYEEVPGGSGVVYEEVVSALTTGKPSYKVRQTAEGKYIISVAVPIQRFRAVLGALQLTREGDIDEINAEQRNAILGVFGVAAFVTAVLSLLLASTIANPLRRLSAAAIRVRRGVRSREEIPDFSHRQDEIGNLSVALRDMTKALYARIDAIESFAADVAHELKNPLTSLGSAVETLPLAKDQRSRDRLMEIIQHDVRRLDRLISDISDASRLDAEMVREDAERIDFRQFVSDLVGAARDVGRNKKKVDITFTVAEKEQNKNYFVAGHDLRLSQVITNLIENARSFVPDDGGRIDLRMGRSAKRIILTVEDNGPGIRADDIERVFERFYTDRPSGEAFGQNSGLGLSISRQIIEAHGGTLTAENIPGAKPGDIRGARFVIALPADE
ncbi:sensor histidine kinase [Nitratireductor thuwali]|uniref:histidine kinase n=1 Tax=Nitratireductor thuwali TaxID=2267699 RepID=A0ABY5MP37_9HYPH|nr:Sensor protein kinase WalK [Nitratireductor thuwali]